MNLQHQIIRYINFFQRSWLWLIVLFFAALTLSVDQTAWAISIQAPYNQTVPTVTPTTEPTPVPTVTPTPAPTTSSTESSTEDESANEATSSFQATDLMATVSVIALNIREADDTSSSIVGTVYLDAEVEILARNQGTTWLYICCTDEDDLPGWVSSQFVEPAFDVLRTSEFVPLYQEEEVEEVEVEIEEEVEAESLDEADSVAEGEDVTTESTESVAEESGTENDATADGDASVAETAVTEPSDEPVAEERPIELEPATLQFEMSYTPEFAWQNQLVEIEFVVTNISDNPAMNVNIRDELLSSLRYVSANAESNGIVETVASSSDGGSSGEIFTITWPELAPQQQVRAIVVVRIAPDLINGGVVDNLAAAGADNAPAVTGGMSVGMPPALLPDFR